MTWVLGVDPGKVYSGWGLVDQRGNPVAHGQTGRGATKTNPGYRTTGDQVRRVIQTCSDCLADAGTVDNVILAIEGQFLKDGAGRDEKDRHKAVATLKTARAAGVWIGACEAAGIQVYEHKGEPAIMSQVWRMGVWGFRPRKDQVKTYAVQITKATWGISIPKSQHHSAEALWIAKYVADLLRFENMQRGLDL